MIPSFALLVSLALGQTATPSLASTLGEKGFSVETTTVNFPPPRFHDGMTAEAERDALRLTAGSERAVDDLTRDSVVAPLILKMRDEPVGDRGVIRVADLWFVVRASIDAIDPGKVAGATQEPQTTEAANMKFTVRRVPAQAAKQAERPDVWFVHVSGRMLDRVGMEATNRIEAEKSASSWTIASRTDPAFDGDPTNGNRWTLLKAAGGGPYPGGASLVTIQRLATVPGALMVEAHLVFFEPKAWFDGAPILRSKIGVVSQDRIRALRRELARSQKTEGLRKQ